MRLILNLLVACCTEATGFVHNIALRSALASESRLMFNTNLRLLTGAHKSIFNPNGMFCNCLMAMLLILSYSSSTLVTLTVYMYPENNQDDAAAGLGTCSVAHARCISPVAMYHCICGVHFHRYPYVEFVAVQHHVCTPAS